MARYQSDWFETGMASRDNWEQPDLAQAQLLLCRRFFNSTRTSVWMMDLRRTVRWKQETIQIHGKLIPVPRLTAWYGDPGKVYSYSGITVHPEPWLPALLEIKHEIEPACGGVFNSVLLNLYRDERDSVSWHADDEPELGLRPVIASVSLGETRRFMLKHRHDKTKKYQIPLGDGSLLLMKGMTQHCWLHQVPKETKPRGPRINLTFRKIRAEQSSFKR